MNLLIIGASGLIGSNCLTFAETLGYNVTGTHFSFPTSKTIYFNTSDFSDKMNGNLQSLHPDVIIHCGALTNVDFCESHSKESYFQTVQSAANIAMLARKSDAVMVYISTDYVFDGTEGPYKEGAITNPLNIYGKHKLEAEEIVRKITSKHIILRVTNVYGKEIRNKNFIARIINDIAENRETSLILPFDQFATPVNAMDIAKGINVLLEEKCIGTYHFGSSDYYSRSQLFFRIMNYFPLYNKFKVRLVSTDQLNQPAKRPLLGGLVSSKFISEFPRFQFSNVDDYLNALFKSAKK